ncbi:tetrapyrrole methylase [Janthinobacterium lividum]|uniref:SAM-dependent methyltransferase n=1 Tax=Janthinobacterium lividum TaxID=29581 RepID=UPI00159618AA|nr:SAM-dependent methyltransferase [Janthinobacterium lividum]QKY04203.1 tetrapyrrole methylase [Janthinobacterium lividum]
MTYTTQAGARCGLYLVSAGIGDPDSITVKAQKTLRGVDIVFGIPRLLEAFADLLDGKELHKAGHGLFSPLARRDTPEEEVDAMEKQTRDIIRAAAAAGKTVAVLDYGDAMIFGPQSGYLSEFSELNPVVVPGISCFNAANAALARDVTGGKHSRSVILAASADTRDDYTGSDTLDKLAATGSTLVFFTMRADLPSLVERLARHLPGSTPLAIVAHAGADAKQAVLRATLGTVLARTENEKPPFEHLVYVGDFLG